MFDFFGNGRKKSLDEMMKDLEEMLGSSYNPMGGGYVVGKSSTEKEHLKKEKAQHLFDAVMHLAPIGVEAVEGAGEDQVFHLALVQCASGKIFLK